MGKELRWRSAGIEWLRVLACAGIVAFHTDMPGAHFACNTLPAFAMVTIALAAGSSARRPWTEFAVGRTYRLLIPWVLWSTIYGSIQTAHALGHGLPPLSWATPWTLMAGASFQLWFLPFAWTASLLCGAVVRMLPAGPGASACAAWTGLGVASLFGAGYCLSRAPPHPPLEQWVFALPSIPLGMALATLERGRRGIMRGCGLLVAVLGACIGLQLAGGPQDLNMSYAEDIVACVAAALAPWPAAGRTMAWSELSFGIYLSHPLVWMLVYRFIPGKVSDLAWVRFAGTASTFAAAAALTAVLGSTGLGALVGLKKKGPSEVYLGRAKRRR